MRPTTILTISTLVCWLWQFWAKKGTRVHVARWVYIFLSSVAVVVINTAQTQSWIDLLPNIFFELHIFSGAAYFLGLIGIAILGLRTFQDSQWKRFHSACAKATFALLIISLIFAVLIPFGK